MIGVAAGFVRAAAPRSVFAQISVIGCRRGTSDRDPPAGSARARFVKGGGCVLGGVLASAVFRGGRMEPDGVDGLVGLDQGLRVEIEAIVGHRFLDERLLWRALRHASVAESRLESNERMEFLGDAVLGMIVCERIFQMYPEALEGEMTKIKSLAVSRRTCAKLARAMGLEDHIVVGKGMRTAERLPASLAAAVLESIIAAVYLDGGMGVVCRFLGPLIDPLIEDAVRSGHQNNFKSVLQQHAQQTMGASPQYRILAEKGPDHSKAFHIAVELAGVTYEASWGQSKKQAEQQAALNALCTMGLVEHDEQGVSRLVDGGAGTANGGGMVLLDGEADED
jgi:ribonuclease-3